MVQYNFFFIFPPPPIYNSIGIILELIQMFYRLSPKNIFEELNCWNECSNLRSMQLDVGTKKSLLSNIAMFFFQAIRNCSVDNSLDHNGILQSIPDAKGQIKSVG